MSGDPGDSNAALILLPDDREHILPDEDFQFVPDEPTEGCWQARRIYGANDLGRSRVLGPGETFSGGYTLLAHPEGDCLAPGTYRIEEHYSPLDATWGFEITLSE